MLWPLSVLAVGDNWKNVALSTISLPFQGRLQGGKWTQLASSLAQGGKEFHPQGGKNSTFKGGRIPPQIYGSHNL